MRLWHVRQWLFGYAVYSVTIAAVAFPIVYGWTHKAALTVFWWTVDTIVVSALAGVVQDWRALRRARRGTSN